MFIRSLLGFVLFFTIHAIAVAETITIAAASDLKFAMDEVIANFKHSNPGDVVNVTYGSSGKFFTQIQQGAPFDLYFSADISFPRELAKMNLAASDVIPYAFGRIVLWSASLPAKQMTLSSLTAANIKRIAIANPQHAPYGKRAVEALQAGKIWPAVEKKLVFGENIAQTAQFVQSGNAEVGIIALALALSPELKRHGDYYLIPDDLHEPLEQGFIITQRAAGNATARRFADYMRSPSVQRIMNQFGFVLPAPQANK